MSSIGEGQRVPGHQGTIPAITSHRAYEKRPGAPSQAPGEEAGSGCNGKEEFTPSGEVGRGSVPEGPGTAFKPGSFSAEKFKALWRMAGGTGREQQQSSSAKTTDFHSGPGATAGTDGSPDFAAPAQEPNGTATPQSLLKSAVPGAIAQAVSSHNMRRNDLAPRIEAGSNGTLLMLDDEESESRIKDAAPAPAPRPRAGQPSPAPAKQDDMPAPAPVDPKKAESMRKEYEGARAKADKEYKYGLSVAEKASQGEGVHILPGGEREEIKKSAKGTTVITTTYPDGRSKKEEVSTAANGSTVITASLPDGSSKMVQFSKDIPGQVLLQEKAADTLDAEGKKIPGEITSLYRYRDRLRVGPGFTGAMEGKGPSRTYRMSGEGNLTCTEAVYGGEPGLFRKLSLYDFKGDGTATSMEYRERINEKDVEQGKANDEIRVIRERVNSKMRDAQGRQITGEGQNIGFLDVDFDEFAQQCGGHSFGVSGKINNAEHGVAPGATTKGFGLEKNGTGMQQAGPDFFPNLNTLIKPPAGMNPEGEKLEDNAESLNRFLAKSGSFDLLNRRLESLLQDVRSGKEKMSALNISIGGGGSADLNTVLRIIGEKKEDGSFAFPGIREAVLGSGGDKLTVRQQMEKIIGYVDKEHNRPGSAFSESLKRYQEVTRGLSEAGVSVVVAAGNGNGNYRPGDPGPPDRPPWGEVKPGTDLNALAMSNHVIVVSGSDSSGTAGSYGDDGLAHYGLDGSGAPPSGQGPGGYNPTVLAPGVHINAPGGAPGSGMGSSLAAPYVCGVIALMKQVNPSLTPQQIKQILSDTAVDISKLSGGRIPAHTAGAGVVDPEQAVLRARQLAVGVNP
ncbi:MAG: S8 family serine peptidase [Candidatus Eremiobacteraeota bacterium]|nr:S8 family serine peptidase [Candidatus Eremiobacteraeota bacterium]